MKSIVSVRMPSTLVLEMRRLAKENHYLDISELIRSIVRTKASQLTTPYAEDLKRVVADLEREISQRKRLDERQELIDNIKRVLEGSS